MLTLAARHVRQWLRYQDRLYFTVDKKQPGRENEIIKCTHYFRGNMTSYVSLLASLAVSTPIAKYDTGLEKKEQFIVRVASTCPLEMCFRGLFTLLIKTGRCHLTAVRDL